MYQERRTFLLQSEAAKVDKSLKKKKKTAEKEKVSLLVKIKVMPPFCMLSQLVSLQPSEQSFQRREIT